jgi:hypothetical protein
MVESYSKGSLTYSVDKLIAISGLAKSVQTDLECPYLADSRWIVVKGLGTSVGLESQVAYAAS